MIRENSARRKYITFSEGDENLILENCFLENGNIVSRKGLEATGSDVFVKSDMSVEEMSFIDTDCYLYFGKKYGRVTVSVSDNLTDNIIYNIRLVCSDGSVENLGQIIFSRVTYEQFGVPDSFTVSSMRLDSVVKNAFRISRGDAAAAIESGVVYVNDVECTKPDKKIAEGDKIVFRRKGRIIVNDCSSVSKKGRVIVEITRFM